MQTAYMQQPIKKDQSATSLPNSRQATRLKEDKSNDEFSKILADKEKQEDKKNSTTEKEKKQDKEKQEHLQKDLAHNLNGTDKLNALHYFLHNLIHRDPSTWSVADKVRYQVGEHAVSIVEFSRMLAARNIKAQDLSFEQLKKLATFNNRRQFSVFLDQWRPELKVNLNGSYTLEKKKLFEQKTSLQEIASHEKVKENQIIQDIVKQISLNNIPKGGEIKIILHPEALGEVSLQVQVADNQVKATFKTKREDVKAILSLNLHELREAFTKKGIAVQNLSVEKIV